MEGEGSLEGVGLPCGAKSDLYVCVICGYVGCGRHSTSNHARAHYEETLHAYALEIDTQQVDPLGVGTVGHRRWGQTLK